MAHIFASNETIFIILMFFHKVRLQCLANGRCGMLFLLSTNACVCVKGNTYSVLATHYPLTSNAKLLPFCIYLSMRKTSISSKYKCLLGSWAVKCFSGELKNVRTCEFTFEIVWQEPQQTARKLFLVSVFKTTNVDHDDDDDSKTYSVHAICALRCCLCLENGKYLCSSLQTKNGFGKSNTRHENVCISHICVSSKWTFNMHTSR